MFRQYTLASAGEVGSDFSISREGWERALNLAHVYGWQPAGTEAPFLWEVEGRAWDGSYPKGYTADNLQFITAEDAAAIADALGKALDNIPNHDTITMHETRRLGGLPLPNGAALLTDQPQTTKVLKGKGEARNHEFSGGQGKEHLRRLVAFCRKGAFIITYW